MKKLLVVMALAIVLALCPWVSVEGSGVSPKQTIQVIESKSGLAIGYFVLRDTLTGKQYLAVSIGQGTAMVQLEGR